eukprot:TRINITY_DN9263_c0_g1_i1.p1 TRINITY_DN9263_c0_g1~~TRINITY_DN9263_c0_g1_i1.p1  ORF type:complete len:499 (+),score=143.27 TRINITY_DN9263_c0_g1_i1:945-2441(+)
MGGWCCRPTVDQDAAEVAVGSVDCVVECDSSIVPTQTACGSDGVGGGLGWRLYSHPLEPFDMVVCAWMLEQNMPGAQLAVARDGRLVYARGYGVADVDSGSPVGPQTLFRLASISKCFTAVAVLQLVERGRLSLDECVLPMLLKVLAGRWAAPVAVADPRWQRITVRHLLQHTAGWDRDVSFDPMFRSAEVCREYGMPPPFDVLSVARYMLEKRPLDFEPGSRMCYSNFGYSLLGRVIEFVSAQPYQRFVHESVFVPIGARSLRLGCSVPPSEFRLATTTGGDQPSDQQQQGQQPDGRSDVAPERDQRETRYYCAASDGLADNALAPINGDHDARVAWPYGGFCLEAMDSHGGWVGNAPDLMRFSSALFGPASPLLSAQSLQLLQSPPEPPVSRTESGAVEPAFYGAGFMIRPVGSKANIWHNGSLPGTLTLLVHRHDGLDWAVLSNFRSEPGNGCDMSIDAQLHRAAAMVVGSWPTHDLFDHPLFAPQRAHAHGSLQ